VAALGNCYGDRIKVSCIDIRLCDYRVVENDGSLWIERSKEAGRQILRLR
jgi:hypothetical protein